MNRPIFIAAVFKKVVVWTLLAALALLIGAKVLFGRVAALDIGGALISAIIIAYIVHLWVYYGSGSVDD